MITDPADRYHDCSFFAVNLAPGAVEKRWTAL
jgi:hypothetical protein